MVITELSRNAWMSSSRILIHKAFFKRIRRCWLSSLDPRYIDFTKSKEISETRLDHHRLLVWQEVSGHVQKKKITHKRYNHEMSTTSEYKISENNVIQYPFWVLWFVLLLFKHQSWCLTCHLRTLATYKRFMSRLTRRAHQKSVFFFFISAFDFFGEVKLECLSQFSQS